MKLNRCSQIFCMGLVAFTATNAVADIITSGTSYIGNSVYAGYSGGTGTIEVNASGTDTALSDISGLFIGFVDNASGTVSVVGDGVTSGSAQISVTGSGGVRNGEGGNGLLAITDGGVVHADGSDVRLGSQSSNTTASTSITNIDGDGSILRTTQDSSSYNGGRIYVGSGGQSNSTVNVTNGGLMEALSKEENVSGDDGSIWIGTSADEGSTSIVNVTGENSTVHASNYIEVGGRDSGVTAQLNVTDGGTVVIDGNVPLVFSDGEVYGETELYIAGLDGEASVSVSGTGSSLSAENVQIGGEPVIAGYTSDGSVVASVAAQYEDDAEGQPVTDSNGDPIYDSEGNQVFTVLVNTFVIGETTYDFYGPSTYVDGNEIYVKAAGSLLIEDNAIFTGSIIDVSSDNEEAEAINGESSVLTVRDGGTIYADVNVYEDGILNGADGTIVGDVLIDGGILAPGNSPGTMTFDGDLDLFEGVLELEIGELESDFLMVSGDLNIGDDFIFDLIFDFEPIDYTINLEDFFDVAGDIILSAGFDLSQNLLFTGLSSDSSLTVNFFGQQFVIDTVNEVPTPSSLLLMLIAFFGVITLKNKRKSLIN